MRSKKIFLLYNLKLPVKSEIPGFNKKEAKKFAPLDIIFLMGVHPYTPIENYL